MARLRAAVAAFGLFACAAAAPAEPPEDPKVAAAVARGAASLQRLHAAGVQGESGSAGLCGLALLEGGVKADDPAVQNIAKHIRTTWPTDTRTYHVALAILFLDRLGDANDIPAIQLLGTRLYGGMTRAGGYGYECADLVPLSAVGKSEAELTAGNPAAAPKPEVKKPDNGFPAAVGRKPNAPAAVAGKLHPSVAGYNAAVRLAVGAGGRPAAGGDNSNTQFGLIGLWVAARHGVPVDDAFVLLEARFLTTQNPGDAGWSYNGTGGASSPAMTCAGLLGLAIGTSRNQPAEAAPAPAPAADSGDPFDRTKKPKAAAGGGVNPVGVNPLVPAMSAAMRKASIDHGLKYLGFAIRSSSGPQNAPGQLSGFSDVCYTLWSIERVGMAYGLDTIGDIDWHRWGSAHLLAMQSPDGGWPAGTHGGPEVATSFAVLFLSKSNFVKDLTRRLTGQVKDPGKAELRAGRDFKPPAAMLPAAVPEPGVRPAEPVAAASAQVIAEGLVNGPDFPTALRDAKDTKGTEFTAALVSAIPRLNDQRRDQARDALAERLTRMTAKTLRTMLTDPDSELRRAAALACAMKDDKAHVGDLIGRVVDPSDAVVQAARAGLKSLTGQDFGPPAGSDDEARKKAAGSWSRWYLSDAKK